MKSWLLALHTAWSAAVAAAQYNRTSTNTIHTYANWYEQITLGHHVAHHGLCRLYLSSKNKSKPDAAHILYYVEQTGA